LAPFCANAVDGACRPVPIRVYTGLRVPARLAPNGARGELVARHPQAPELVGTSVRASPTLKCGSVERFLGAAVEDCISARACCCRAPWCCELPRSADLLIRASQRRSPTPRPPHPRKGGRRDALCSGCVLVPDPANDRIPVCASSFRELTRPSPASARLGAERRPFWTHRWGVDESGSRAVIPRLSSR